MPSIKWDWTVERNDEHLAEIAKNALVDAKNRQYAMDGQVAGSIAWKKREPILAAALLKRLGQAERDVTTVTANLKGEIRLLSEQLGQVQAQLRDALFERDRMRLAWLAAVDVIDTLVANHVDPEYLDAKIRSRIAEVRPDDAPGWTREEGR